MGVRLERGAVHGWDGWWIRRGALALGLTPTVGGRIMSMRWRDDELAFVHPDHAGRYVDVAAATDVTALKRALGFIHWGGDKTWLAPQERWSEAIPSLDLDGGAYAITAEVDDGSTVRVRMTSPPCRETGVRLTRTVTVSDRDEEWLVEHMVENVGHGSIAWGLWAVQQLRGPGVAWVPRRAEGSAFPDGVKAYPAEGDSEAARGAVVRVVGDVARIDCRRRRWFKFGVDADEGWVLAVVEAPSGRLVAHRKRVDVVAGAAYAHGSVVEVYNCPDHLYFEVELHGPVVTLRPGERTTLVERRRTWAVDAAPETPDAVRARATR
jgi:hypothetical protein